MLALRKIVFYVFVAVYLVLCPLTILYALGYAVRPGMEEGLVKTGLIALSSAPPDASVYLNNRRYTLKTPTVLRDLLPGAYTVKVVRRHYQPWVRTLPVEPERATVYERILLAPLRWHRRTLLDASFDDLLPLHGTAFCVLTSGSRLEDAVVYDWKTESATPLLPEGSPWRESRLISVHSVRASSMLLLRVAGKEGDRYLWVDVQGRQPYVADVTHLFPRRPERVVWDPREPTQLFALSEDRLSRLDLLTGMVAPDVAESVLGYGVHNRRLYVLDREGRFARRTLDGVEEKQLLDDPTLSRALFRPRGLYEIQVLSEDLMVFLGERGDLVSNRLPYRFAEREVIGLEPEPGGKRLLVWTRTSLGVLSFSPTSQRGGVFEHAPSVHWLLTDGRDIEQAYWVYEGSHALYRDGQTLRLVELDVDGTHAVRDVVDVRRRSGVLYAEETGLLYLLDRSTGRLSALELLPRRELLALPDER